MCWQLPGVQYIKEGLSQSLPSNLELARMSCLHDESESSNSLLVAWIAGQHTQAA